MVCLCLIAHRASYADLHSFQSGPSAAFTSTLKLVILGKYIKKPNILTSPSSTTTIRPLLEHGGRYMQYNVSN